MYIVVFAVCIFSGVHFNVLGLLCLPVVMLLEYCMTIGITMLFSALTVYLRDIEHILGIIAMAWMFMTPIMYQLKQIPDRLLPVFNLNPMTHIITAYRDILYWGSVPQMDTLMGGLWMTIFILVLGFYVFGRLKRRFAEEM